MDKNTVKKSKNVFIKGKPKDGKVTVVKLDRSFASLIIQNSKLKEFYSKIKNYCLSFEGVKARSSWGAESFTTGKDTLVKLVVRGGALCLCFALSPESYDPSEYPHQDLSHLKTYENTPMLVPVRNAADYKVARRLSADAFTTHFVYSLEFPKEVDYVKQLPSESDEALIKKKLIKATESTMKVSDAEKLVAAAAEEEEKAEIEMNDVWESAPKKEPKKRKPKKEETPEPLPEDLPQRDEIQENENEEKPASEEVKAPLFVTRYDRSFLSRIIQNEKAKAFYSDLKNYCLALGLKSRLSWAAESFYLGRKTYAKAKVRGKTLRVYLALDPTLFEIAKYHHTDASDKKAYADYPMMVRVKSPLGLKRAKNLIALAAAERNLTEKDASKVDYASLLPYEETDALIEKGLIKEYEAKAASFPRGLSERGQDKEIEEDDIEDVDFDLADEEDAQSDATGSEENEEIEDVVFDLLDGETSKESEEEEIEDVSFELAEEENADGSDEEEDVEFELAEEEAPNGELLSDGKGDMNSYDPVDLAGRYVTLKKYVRGFTAKLKQGAHERKEYYTAIKTELLSCKGVKIRDSFPGETFYKGRDTLLKSRIRGKTLCLFFALNVDDYKQTVYHQQYMGEIKAYEATPMMIRIKSEQGLTRALRLVEELVRVHSLEKSATPPSNVRSEYLYEETADLVQKGLVKTKLVSVPYYEAQELLKKQNK